MSETPKIAFVIFFVHSGKAKAGHCPVEMGLRPLPLLEPKVAVCDRRYVFDAYPPPNSSQPLVFDPTDKCPTFVVNASIAGLALEKQHADEVEYARLVKENLPVASTFSGLDGGMNKVFLARFPDRIIPLAIVLTNGPQLPQMSPIPWTDDNGSLADKVFGGSFESRSPSQTRVALTASPMQEPRANLAITKQRSAD